MPSAWPGTGWCWYWVVLVLAGPRPPAAVALAGACWLQGRAAVTRLPGTPVLPSGPRRTGLSPLPRQRVGCVVPWPQLPGMSEVVRGLHLSSF